MKCYKKNQMTVDLIIVSALVLALFLTLFSIIDYRNNEISSSKRYLNSKDVADEIAWSINEVYISGFGTRKTINIVNTTFDLEPIKITIMPKNRLVLVEWENNFYTSSLLTSRVVNLNNRSEEEITIVMGRLIISNYMGEIRLVQ